MTPNHEKHFTNRIGWLRAAVLGANDGIVSTASLIAGVAAADATREHIFLAGTAALVAGAMSMAAGEYVSVSSQADTEKADLRREEEELATNPVYERQELADIYVSRGLDSELAGQVAEQLMAHDALAAHARDELGLSSTLAARPIQAAFASATAFTTGAALPLLTVLLTPDLPVLISVFCSSLVFLAALGFISAYAGGAKVPTSMLRITAWGAAAMAVTASVGEMIDVIR